jgi:hypothetical protein
MALWLGQHNPDCQHWTPSDRGAMWCPAEPADSDARSTGSRSGLFNPIMGGFRSRVREVLSEKGKCSSTNMTSVTAGCTGYSLRRFSRWNLAGAIPCALAGSLALAHHRMTRMSRISGARGRGRCWRWLAGVWRIRGRRVRRTG